MEVLRIILNNKLPERKFISLLITLMWGLSIFGNASLAETEVENTPEVKEITEKERVILDQLKDGVEALEEPVMTMVMKGMYRTPRLST